MALYYAHSTGGFYNTEIHPELPADAVEITTQQHESLLVAKNSGQLLEMQDGAPVARAKAPELLAAEAALRVDVLRQEAYRREADPLFFQWQRGEADEQDWLDKIEEIKQRYKDA